MVTGTNRDPKSPVFAGLFYLPENLFFVKFVKISVEKTAKTSKLSNIRIGSVPERLKGMDCKSIG